MLSFTPIIGHFGNVKVKDYLFYIDVFSYCNLRCPSCVVGNKYGDLSEWPRGLVSPQLLGRILDKAVSECRVVAVGLYNWTEPLLHPEIAELISVVSSRGIDCAISSNLNLLRDPEAILRAAPKFFRISLSGFSQEIYARGHRQGDIETVKRNMRRLAEARTTVGNTSTHIDVNYHQYVDNRHEIEAMRDFATSLGFHFLTTLARIHPVEKIISIADGHESAADRILLDRLALPLDRALAVTSAAGLPNCELLDDMIVLDVTGNVMLCCGSSMKRSNAVGQFLDHPIEELQRRRRELTLCKRCVELGIPTYFQGHNSDEFARIAEETFALKEVVPLPDDQPPLSGPLRKLV